jgi:hypothetical protein
MSKRSMTYEELIAAMRGSVLDPATLDDDTLVRALHLARFFVALSKAAPHSRMKVGDVLTEAEVTKIWLDTADPNYDPGPCPPLQ